MAKTKSFILSMTSYPPRFNNLLDCLLNLNEQTVHPEKLVLNIAFDDIDFLPIELQTLQLEFPIEVNLTEDIGPGKKLIPTLTKYPNSVIVTIDDDIRYRPELLQTLLEESSANPTAIICSRAHEPSFADGFPNPYIAWQFEVENIINRLCCPTSGAGVLFPPLSLHKDVLDIHQYKSMSFSTDDLWYWVHAIKNRTRIIKTKDSFKINEIVNDVSLPLHSANIMVLNTYNLEKMWLAYSMNTELQEYCEMLSVKIATHEDLSEYQRMLLEFRLSFLNSNLYELLDSLPSDLQLKTAREVSVGYQRLLELIISSRSLSFSSKALARNSIRKIRKLIKDLRQSDFDD